MTRKQFQKFYNAHVERVYKFVYLRVGGRQDVAEDLTAEVFMKALEHLDKLDPKGQPLAWLMTVTRNKLKNYYRDTKQHTDVDEVAHLLESAESGSRIAELTDAKQIIELLATLQEEARQIIELKHLQGFSFKEIGEILGKKPGAIRVQAHRAMKALKSHVDV